MSEVAKNVFRRAGILALLFSVLGISPVPASAGPAVVIKDTLCVLLDGQGVPFLVMESVVIGTDSTTDISMASCKGTVLPPLSGQAVQWDTTNWPPPTGGGLCSTGFGITARWQDTVSSSGQSSLSCHYPTHP